MTMLTIGTAQYLVIIVGLIVAIVTLLSEKPVRRNMIKLAILSFLIAFLIAFVAGIFYYDPRPFVVEHIDPLIPHQPDNGFPSDHTLIAMVMAATVFVFRRKLGILLGVLGILVGISRVVAEVHHPIDIVGSIVIAIMATYSAWMISNKLDRISKILLDRLCSHR